MEKDWMGLGSRGLGRQLGGGLECLCVRGSGRIMQLNLHAAALQRLADPKVWEVRKGFPDPMAGPLWLFGAHLVPFCLLHSLGSGGA